VADPRLSEGAAATDSARHCGGLWRLLEWPAIGCGAAVDAVVLALMKGPWAQPKSADLGRLATEVRSAHTLYRSAGWFERPLEFHRPPPAVADRFSITGPHWPLGHEWLSFASDYALHPEDPAAGRWQSYERNRIAHAWMLRRDESAPWLICLHGAGTGHPLIDAQVFAARRLHATLGLNLLFPVQPLHGARRVPEVGIGGFLSFELLDTLHGFAQAVWDTRCLIAWMRESGVRRIGLYGLSLGAYTSALLAMLEPVDFVLAGIPLCDVPDLYAGHSSGAIRRLAEESGVLSPELHELFTLVSPLAAKPTPPRAHRFLFAASADGIAPPLQAQRLWEHWERPDIFWYPGGHVSFFWTRAVQSFVDQSLRRSLLDKAALA